MILPPAPSNEKTSVQTAARALKDKEQPRGKMSGWKKPQRFNEQLRDIVLHCINIWAHNGKKGDRD